MAALNTKKQEVKKVVTKTTKPKVGSLAAMQIAAQIAKQHLKNYSL